MPRHDSKSANDRFDCPVRAWWRSIALVAATATLLAGCASFPDERLPKVDTVPSQAQFTNKPSAYIALRFAFDLSGGGEKPGHEMSAAVPKLREAVDKVVKEAALFRSYTFDSFESRDAEYVLQIEMKNYGSAGKAAVAGFITGLTLFIIPSAATDNYKLTAKLLDRDGKVLRSYVYDDGITSWFGIWLLPVAANTPARAAQSVWENMIRTLFRDIVKDQLLPYSLFDPRHRILS